MPRKPRIEFPGALYHVYSRGNQKQKIFLDESDFSLFIKRLAEYKKEYGFMIYAYVLMDNHFHLLIETRDIGLSKIMQGLIQSYTQYFNLKYKKVGHLFQGRYKAILCQKDEYLLELIRYLHLNPVRAGLAESPDEYQWSGHADYLVGAAGFVDIGPALAIFASNRKIALEKYKRFIADGADMSQNDRFYAVVDQRFLGSEEFVKEIGTMPAADPVDPKEMACDFCNVWKVVERLFNVTKAELLGSGRAEEIVSARAVFAILCADLGKKNKEIALELRRDPAMITRLVKMGRTSLKKKAEKAADLLKSRSQA